MKNNIVDQPNSLNLKNIFSNLIYYSLLIGLGLAIGVSFGFYLKDSSLDVKLSRSSIEQIPQSEQPSVLLPPSPAPESAQTPPPEPAQTPPPPPPAPISETNVSISVNKTLLNLIEETSWNELVRDLRDEELLWIATMASRIKKFSSKGEPKVAFMFLTKGALPFAPLWEKFFRGHEGLFSIYVHSSPEFVDNTTTNSVFYDRRIHSEKVEWGKVNMIEAERRLLAHALLDTLNQRFVLLSESGIPLFNFNTVYNYLIHSTKSHVESYDLKGPTGSGRYNTRMLPQIRKKQWRKGSQWFEMDREIAMNIVSDQTYFPVFQKHCKNTCYSDEHYLPTFVTMKFAEKNSNRTLMWTDWSKGGPHPTKYSRTFVTVELLEKLRNSDGAKCDHNGHTTNICFLFARKFNPNALNRLLFFAPRVMQF